MSVVALGPKMMGVGKRIAAPMVLIDSELVGTPEELGFDFEEFHEIMRISGVTDEQVETYTVHYRDRANGPDLGTYLSKSRQTNIYVNNCRREADEAAVSTKPVKAFGGYRATSHDASTVINDVTIHESGHFVHDMLHPTYTARMRALKIGAAITTLSPIGMVADFLEKGPYYEAAPIGIGVTAAIILAGGLVYSRVNPFEGSAFRFQEQFGERRIVNFAPDSSS